MISRRIQMLVDYHVHPDYSLDAEGTIDEYCRRALAIGLDEICFTTHHDIFSSRRGIDMVAKVRRRLKKMNPNWLESYFDEIDRARKAYSESGLKVKIGVEVDYYPDLEDETRNDLSGYPFDYILGSVHCLDHICITHPKEYLKYFKDRTASELCEEYYFVLREAVRSGIFDVMAHLDIYRWYGTEYYGEEALSSYYGLADHILDLMVKNGIGLEINASAFRRGDNEPYPSIGLLKKGMQKGIKVFTVGSDCHRIIDLGRDIERALYVAQKLGIRVHTFSERKVKRTF